MAARISISQAPAWAGALKGKLKKAAVRGVRAAGDRLIGEILKVIDELDPKPVDRGLYRAGWRSTPITDGVFIHNATPYASIIEWGARAANIRIGRAMIEALAEWVVRKGIVPKRTDGSTVSEATAMAWAIAMNMKKRGIFNRSGEQGGLRVLERAKKKLPQFIGEEVKREVEAERGRG